MMEQGFTDLIGKYGIGAAVIIYGASKLIPGLFAARADAAGESARTDIIETLSARLKAVEDDIEAYRRKLEEERSLRVAAQDEVAALKRRVASLESQIRALGQEPK
ncbi:MAG: hypothetical protein ACTHK2_04965 [Dokdonella sp.]|uniref:hypothetical protein n=1 Tax=Dokdonella sp. TaxID=2291710 RepID=UPI003F81B792